MRIGSWSRHRPEVEREEGGLIAYFAYSSSAFIHFQQFLLIVLFFELFSCEECAGKVGLGRERRVARLGGESGYEGRKVGLLRHRSRPSPASRAWLNR